MPADKTSDKDKAPASAGKKLRLRPPLFLLLVAAAVGALAFEAFWPASAEHHWIRAQRYFRVTMAGFGLPLPGTPDLGNFQGRLKANGVALGAPIFMRVFKREFELELWMMRDGRFHRFATYPICKWSGRLGPKIAQGDRLLLTARGTVVDRDFFFATNNTATPDASIVGTPWSAFRQ